MAAPCSGRLLWRERDDTHRDLSAPAYRRVGTLLRTAIDGDRGLAAAALRVGIEILGVALSAGPRTAAGDGSASLARPMTAVRVAFIKLRALVLRIILRADHADIVAVFDLLGLQRSEEHTSELQS